MTRTNLFPFKRAHDPEPAQARAYVRKATALLCGEAGCEAIYTSDGLPCPACGSPHGFPIARWVAALDETTAADEALRGAKEGG